MSPNTPDRFGQTGVHYHIGEATFMSLLKHGADVDARDNNGRTALLNSIREASITKMLDKVTRLLTAGADPDAEDLGGTTPRQIIKHTGLDEAARLIDVIDARKAISRAVKAVHSGKFGNR